MSLRLEFFLLVWGLAFGLGLGLAGGAPEKVRNDGHVSKHHRVFHVVWVLGRRETVLWSGGHLRREVLETRQE